MDSINASHHNPFWFESWLQGHTVLLVSEELAQV